MNKLLPTLPLFVGFLLCTQVSMSQVDRQQTPSETKISNLQSTSSQGSNTPDRKNVQNISSSSETTAASTRLGAAQLSSPFHRETKLSPSTSSNANGPTHAPGQGDANLYRSKLARFMVGDALPTGFPEWDIATMTKEEYKAIVRVWAKENKSKVKPEYHTHKIFESK